MRDQVRIFFSSPCITGIEIQGVAGTDTVLIVDDSSFIVEGLIAFLKKKYHTLAAYGGAECLEILKRETPSVIILDIVMEPMDGWETLSRIKENPATRNIPVLMFSAKKISPEEAEVHRFHIDDFITKPVSPGKIIEAIDKVLARRESNGKLVERWKKAGIGQEKIDEYLSLVTGLEVDLSLCQNMKVQHDLLPKAEQDQPGFREMMDALRSRIREERTMSEALSREMEEAVERAAVSNEPERAGSTGTPGESPVMQQEEAGVPGAVQAHPEDDEPQKAPLPEPAEPEQPEPAVTTAAVPEISPALVPEPAEPEQPEPAVTAAAVPEISPAPVPGPAEPEQPEPAVTPGAGPEIPPAPVPEQPARVQPEEEVLQPDPVPLSPAPPEPATAGSPPGPAPGPAGTAAPETAEPPAPGTVSPGPGTESPHPVQDTGAAGAEGGASPLPAPLPEPSGTTAPLPSGSSTAVPEKRHVIPADPDAPLGGSRTSAVTGAGTDVPMPFDSSQRDRLPRSRALAPDRKKQAQDKGAGAGNPGIFARILSFIRSLTGKK